MYHGLAKNITSNMNRSDKFQYITSNSSYSDKNPLIECVNIPLNSDQM